MCGAQRLLPLPVRHTHHTNEPLQRWVANLGQMPQEEGGRGQGQPPAGAASFSGPAGFGQGWLSLGRRHRWHERARDPVCKILDGGLLGLGRLRPPQAKCRAERRIEEIQENPSARRSTDSKGRGPSGVERAAASSKELTNAVKSMDLLGNPSHVR